MTKPEDTKYLRLSGPFKENYGPIAFNCYQAGMMLFVEKWYRNISVNLLFIICNQESEPEAAAQSHTGTLNRTIQPSTPQALGFG